MCCSPTGPTSRPGLQAPDKYSSGTSCWSCWGGARAGPSAGEGSGANSSYGTLRGWPGCGGRGRANHTTMTSSAGRSTTTTNASCTRPKGKGSPTSSTS
uniref:Uncharacterized protein n=1 Tax=Seriola lalandi dorsalis TaxID=1841481 RepID=A0A3B4X6B5_SERLL